MCPFSVILCLLLRQLILRWLFLIQTKGQLEKTGCQGNPYFLLADSLGVPFHNTVSQASFGFLLLTVQHWCDLQDAKPFHSSLSASHQPLTQESTGFPYGWQAF